MLSNHDTARHLSRYAREPGGERGVNLRHPPAWEALAVTVQDGDPASMLELYRAALRLRRAHPALGDGTSGAPAPLPGGTAVLLASGPLPPGGEVPEDTAVWLGGQVGG